MMRTSIVAACAAALLLAGCGGGDDEAKRAPTQTSPSGYSERPPAAARLARPSHRVTLHAPRGWAVPAKRVSRRGWPKPVHVAASFPIHRLPANTSCPHSILERIPADGVYMFVAEYTSPRPRGIPPGRPLGPRPDLRNLPIADEEVECWDGPGGSADFKEKGRAFRVEVLFGRRTTATQRQRALDALATLRVAK